MYCPQPSARLGTTGKRQSNGEILCYCSHFAQHRLDSPGVQSRRSVSTSSGWDEANFTCWVNTRRSSGLSVPTQSFWIALAATIETICSVTDMLCDRARLDGEVSYYQAILTLPS